MKKKYIIFIIIVFYFIINNSINTDKNDNLYEEVVSEKAIVYSFEATETVTSKKNYSNINEKINYSISNDKETLYDEKLIGRNNFIEIRDIAFDKNLDYNLYEYTYIENQRKANDNSLTYDKKISYLQLKFNNENKNEAHINTALKSHLEVVLKLPNYNIYDRRGMMYSKYGKINNNFISYCTLYALDNPNGGNEELITTNIYLNYDALKNVENINLQLYDFIEDFNGLAKYYLENKCSFYNPENSYNDNLFKKFNTNKGVNQKEIEKLSKELEKSETKWFITKDNELVIFFPYGSMLNVGYSVKLNDIKELLTQKAFKLLNNENYNILID